MQHIYLKHTSDSALKKLLISFASQSPNCLRALISGVEQALPSFLQSSDLAIKKHWFSYHVYTKNDYNHFIQLLRPHQKHVCCAPILRDGERNVSSLFGRFDIRLCFAADDSTLTQSADDPGAFKVEPARRFRVDRVIMKGDSDVVLIHPLSVAFNSTSCIIVYFTAANLNTFAREIINRTKHY